MRHSLVLAVVLSVCPLPAWALTAEQEAKLVPFDGYWYDFFGMSVVEAVFCGCYPLLPRRLSYPEIFPPDSFREFYYDDAYELTAKMTKSLQNIEHTRPAILKQRVGEFSWKIMVCRYDKALESLAESCVPYAS